VGTEFPIEEPSLHSMQVTLETVNRDVILRQFMDTMSSVGDDDSAVSLTKKKIKEAIFIDGQCIETWHSGKLVEGTGIGDHFV